MTLEDALQTLELAVDCSFIDAKKAYKDLIQVWHSDRHAHNAKLLERAHLKTQKLNEAWALITKIGEKDFPQHLAKLKGTAKKEHTTEEGTKPNTDTTQAANQKKSDIRKEIKLKEFAPTGVMMVPIWQNATRRVPRRMTLIVALALFMAGIIQIRSIGSAILLLVSGEPYDGVVELCGKQGKESHIGFAGMNLVKDIPERYLSLAVGKNGQLVYTCPEHISITFIPAFPQESVIGRPPSAWYSVGLPLLLYLIIPVVLLRRNSKT